jgi:hypothetical protein
MFCQANGMDLFDISSEESKTALFDYAAEIFGEGSGSMIIVKGRDSGECQYIDNTFGPYNAHYGDCLEDYYFFCGYQNVNPVEFMYTENAKSLECKFLKPLKPLNFMFKISLAEF